MSWKDTGQVSFLDHLQLWLEIVCSSMLCCELCSLDSSPAGQRLLERTAPTQGTTKKPDVARLSSSEKMKKRPHGLGA